MISGGFSILSNIMEIYFSKPDEDNVSDDIAEALMCSVIRNLRAAIQNSKDYTARSNLLWASAMTQNRIIKLGKKDDFECHQIEHQLENYTDCSHGCGAAVLYPVYYRHIYKSNLKKFVRFSENVWKISRDGKSEEQLAKDGIDALTRFIQTIGLPTTLRELKIQDKNKVKEIADACNRSLEIHRKTTDKDILEIFEECF